MYVSVIIPVFNDQQGLERCLYAVDKQVGVDPTKLEIIVVDNGSAPPIYIPNLSHAKVHLVTCLKPGSYAARNKGVYKAIGEVLAFIDADCIPSENWLSEGIKLLNSHGDAIVAGDVVFIPSERPTGVEIYQLIVGFCQENNVKNKKFAATANLFVTKSVFQAVGEFDESLLSGGDLEWSRRAQSVGFSLRFNKLAKVYTEPRKSLKAALIQARRVAGGQFSLRQKKVGYEVGFPPKLSLVGRISKIMLACDFSIASRFRALFAAICIMLFQKYEIVKIKLGGDFERR